MNAGESAAPQGLRAAILAASSPINRVNTLDNFA